MSKPNSNQLLSLTMMANLTAKPIKGLGTSRKSDNKPDVAAKSGGLFDQLGKEKELEMKGNGATNEGKTGLEVEESIMKGNSGNKGLFNLNQENSKDGKNDSKSGEMKPNLWFGSNKMKKSFFKVNDPKSEVILEAKKEIPINSEDRVNGSQKSENSKKDLGNSVKNLDNKMTSNESKNDEEEMKNDSILGNEVKDQIESEKLPSQKNMPLIESDPSKLVEMMTNPKKGEEISEKEEAVEKGSGIDSDNNGDRQVNHKVKHSKKGKKKQKKDRQNKPKKTQKTKPPKKQKHSKVKRRRNSQSDNHIYFKLEGLHSSNLAQPNNNNSNSNVQNNTVKILSERQDLPFHNPDSEPPNDSKNSVPNTIVGQNPNLERGPSKSGNIQPDREDQINQRNFTFGNIKRTGQGQDFGLNVGIGRQNNTDSRPQNIANNLNANVNPPRTYDHNDSTLQEPTERRFIEERPRRSENVSNGRVCCSQNKSSQTPRLSHHSERNVNTSNNQYENNYASQRIRIEPSNKKRFPLRTYIERAPKSCRNLSYSRKPTRKSSVYAQRAPRNMGSNDPQNLPLSNHRNYLSKANLLSNFNNHNNDSSRMNIISSRTKRTDNPQLSSHMNLASNFHSRRSTYISNNQHGQILEEVDISWKQCEQCNVLYRAEKIGDEWVNRHGHDHYANVTLEGGRLRSKVFEDFEFFRNEGRANHDRPRSVRVISGRGSQRNVDRDVCDRCEHCGRGLGVSARYVVNDYLSHNNNNVANLSGRSGRVVSFQNYFDVTAVPQTSQRDRIKICPNCYQNQVVERNLQNDGSVERRSSPIERRSNPIEVSHTHQHNHRHVHTTKGPVKKRQRKKNIDWRRSVPNEMLGCNGEQPVEEENYQNRNCGGDNNENGNTENDENVKYGWTDNELPNSLIRPNHLISNPMGIQPATLEGDYQDAHFENQNPRSNFGEGDQNYHRNILSAIGDSQIPRNGHSNPNVHQNFNDSRNSSRPLEIVEHNRNGLNLKAISEKVSQEMISTSNNNNLETDGRSEKYKTGNDNDDNKENDDQIKEVKNDNSDDLADAVLNNTNENNLDKKDNQISTYQQEEFDKLRRELSEMKKIIRQLISSKTKQSSDDTSSQSDKKSDSEKKEKKPIKKNQRPFESTIKNNEQNGRFKVKMKVLKKKKRSNKNRKHKKNNNRHCVRYARNYEGVVRQGHNCRVKSVMFNQGVSLTMYIHNNQYSNLSYTSEMESINRVESDFRNFNHGSSSRKEQKMFMKNQKMKIQSIASSIKKSSTEYLPVHSINMTHSVFEKNYLGKSLEHGESKESCEHGKFI